jgi:SAM-dependent methyltransferase
VEVTVAPPEESIAAEGNAEAVNRSFYDALWSQTRLAPPERFNTWPLIQGLLPGSPMRLEIGPGLRPRLPVAGTHFIDISPPVIHKLNSCGALAQAGQATNLPYDDETFDLLCAFDVIEHVQDDRLAFGELCRVLKPDGILICSVPLHRSLWTAFDDFVGHVRRYDPADLTAILEEHRLLPEKSAVYGMQPNNTRLLELGVWFLTHRRSAALFWYNRVFLPLAIRFQKPLKFSPGVMGNAEAAEIVLVCRRGKR